jgi:hypothetical protein
MIEIERLISEGHEMARTMQQHGVELKSEQLPISALVRCPLLALRWQLPNKQARLRTNAIDQAANSSKIRRAQLKFKTAEDYDTAHNYLYQLGLRMSSASGTPSPTRAAAPENRQLAGPSHSLSRPELSNRPSTAVSAPPPVESQHQEAVHARPMSAFTSSGNEVGSMHTTFSGPLKPPVYFARPDSATREYPSTNPTYASPSLQQPFVTPEHVHSDSGRPETAMLYNRPDTAEAALPPRRELPFARSSLPGSSGSDTAHPPNRPSTSMMGPPPLPMRVTSLRPGSGRPLSRELELPPLPKPTVVSAPHQMPTQQPPPSWMQQQVQQAPRTPNEDHDAPRTANAFVHEDQENRPLSSSSPSPSSPLSYKRASTGAEPSPRPLSSLSNAAQNRRRTESQSPLSNPPTPPTSDSMRQTSKAPEPTPVPLVTPHDSLAGYAMQSEEGRRAALNEFIMRNLEDDNFLTLLEDMESAWARTGLHMN